MSVEATGFGVRALDWLKSLLRPHAAGLPARLEDMTFMVLDTETTGFHLDRDRILSIGVLRLEAGRIRVSDTLELFLIQERFNRNTVPIHGILPGNDPGRIPEAEALQRLLDYLGDAVLVGHHIGFDRDMLQQALNRHGMGKLRNPMLDTEPLYRKTLLKSPLLRKKDRYTLDDLARVYDISCKDRHTALGDAYITAIAFLHILNQLPDAGDLRPEQLLKWGKPL